MNRSAVIAALAGPVISLLARTWRIELAGSYQEWRSLADGHKPYVLLAWHEAMLPLLWHHRKRNMTIVVSEGREGRYLAAYAGRLGFREARGSSSRGGVRALRGAVRALQEGGSAAFTPDGPRGPRREFKRGSLLAAQRGTAPIVSVHAHARSAWRLKSWDRMLIPKPFARVRIAYADIFEIRPGPEALERGEARARQALAQAVQLAEAGIE
jgi:lysophospholipid acyltransferase (LPLAT)-like uncharacterized protein